MEALQGGATAAALAGDVEAELAKYLARLGEMREQLQQTSGQIEESVVGVCTGFQGIAERARATVSQASSFLGEEHAGKAGKSSFDGLIATCGATLEKIMRATAEASAVSGRAIERVRSMDKASRQISAALSQLEQLATGNKMLALNARIEASRAGALGVGFAVVAVELSAQTERSQAVTALVADLAASLRTLAESTVEDLQRTIDRDQERVAQCRSEVEESLGLLRAAHGEMAQMLGAMTQEGALLAADIGSTVRGLQFQDRISQRLSHVIDDLGTIQRRLVIRFGNVAESATVADGGFSAYTMQEERQVAGMLGTESGAGEVELF